MKKILLALVAAMLLLAAGCTNTPTPTAPLSPNGEYKADVGYAVFDRIEKFTNESNKGKVIIEDNKLSMLFSQKDEIPADESGVGKPMAGIIQIKIEAKGKFSENNTVFNTESGATIMVKCEYTGEGAEDYKAMLDEMLQQMPDSEDKQRQTAFLNGEWIEMFDDIYVPSFLQRETIDEICLTLDCKHHVVTKIKLSTKAYDSNYFREMSLTDGVLIETHLVYPSDEGKIAYEYYGNGNLKSKSVYYMNGNKMDEFNYDEAGNLISRHHWDEDGNQIY